MKVKDQTPSSTSLKALANGEDSYGSRDVDEAHNIPLILSVSDEDPSH